MHTRRYTNFVIAILLFFVPQYAFAAISFVAGDAAQNVSPDSVSIDAGTAPNRAVLLFIDAISTSCNPTASFGGQSMTLDRSQTQGSDKTMAFTLINAPSGSNSFSIGGSGCSGNFNGYTAGVWSGVAAFNASTSISNASTNNINTTITTVSANSVVAQHAVAYSGGTNSAGGNVTFRVSKFNHSLGDGTKATAGSFVQTTNSSTSGPMIAIAIAMATASASTATSVIGLVQAFWW